MTLKGRSWGWNRGARERKEKREEEGDISGKVRLELKELWRVGSKQFLEIYWSHPKRDLLFHKWEKEIHKLLFFLTGLWTFVEELSEGTENEREGKTIASVSGFFPRDEYFLLLFTKRLISKEAANWTRSPSPFSISCDTYVDMDFPRSLRSLISGSASMILPITNSNTCPERSLLMELLPLEAPVIGKRTRTSERRKRKLLKKKLKEKKRSKERRRQS